MKAMIISKKLLIEYDGKRSVLHDPPLVVFNFYVFNRLERDKILSRNYSSVMVLIHGICYMNKGISLEDLKGYLYKEYEYVSKDISVVSVENSLLYLAKHAPNYLRQVYISYNPEMDHSTDDIYREISGHRYNIRTKARKAEVGIIINTLELKDKHTYITSSRIIQLMEATDNNALDKVLLSQLFKDAPNTIRNHIKKFHQDYLDITRNDRSFTKEIHSKYFLEYLKRDNISINKLMREYGIGKKVANAMQELKNSYNKHLKQ